MNIERRLEKLESRLLPYLPPEVIYGFPDGLSEEERRAAIAAEMRARGKPEDYPVITVVFVSPSSPSSSCRPAGKRRRFTVTTTKPVRQRRRARLQARGEQTDGRQRARRAAG